MSPADSGWAGVSVAVTGGIACGKSEAGRILAGAGAAVREADDVSRELMQPGQPVYAAVVERFGKAVVRPDGSLDRGLLGERVFADAVGRRDLNGLVHPEVRRVMAEWAAGMRRQGRVPVGVIPLLFEARMDDGWEVIVCVAASRGTVRDRLRERGLSEESAERRIASQMPLEEKTKRSHYVIWNDGTREDLRERTLRAWREILRKGRVQHA